MKRLNFRQLGTWAFNQERGFYLEAVDLPRGNPRYLQIGISDLDGDSIYKPLETPDREILSLLVDDEDLSATIR